jgi:hypothetical protein
MSDAGRITEAILPSQNKGGSNETLERVDDARLWIATIADLSKDAPVGKHLSGFVASRNGAAEMVIGWIEDEIVGHPSNEVILPMTVQSTTERITGCHRAAMDDHLSAPVDDADAQLAAIAPANGAERSRGSAHLGWDQTYSFWT